MGADYNRAFNILRVLTSFGERAVDLAALVEDLKGGPAPTEETNGVEAWRIKNNQLMSGMLDLADEFDSYVRGHSKYLSKDERFIKERIKELEAENIRLKVKIEEKDKQIEELKKEAGLVNELMQVTTSTLVELFTGFGEKAEELFSIAPWLWKFNENIQKPGETDKQAKHYNNLINTDDLVESYLLANCKITKEMEAKYGMSREGIKKRLLKAGVYERRVK